MSTLYEPQLTGPLLLLSFLMLISMGRSFFACHSQLLYTSGEEESKQHSRNALNKPLIGLCSGIILTLVVDCGVMFIRTRNDPEWPSSAGYALDVIVAWTLCMWTLINKLYKYEHISWLHFVFWLVSLGTETQLGWIWNLEPGKSDQANVSWSPYDQILLGSFVMRYVMLCLVISLSVILIFTGSSTPPPPPPSGITQHLTFETTFTNDDSSRPQNLSKEMGIRVRFIWPPDNMRQKQLYEANHTTSTFTLGEPSISDSDNDWKASSDDDAADTASDTDSNFVNELTLNDTNVDSKTEDHTEDFGVSPFGGTRIKDRNGGSTKDDIDGDLTDNLHELPQTSDTSPQQDQSTKLLCLDSSSKSTCNAPSSTVHQEETFGPSLVESSSPQNINGNIPDSLVSTTPTSSSTSTGQPSKARSINKRKHKKVIFSRLPSRHSSSFPLSIDMIKFLLLIYTILSVFYLTPIYTFDLKNIIFGSGESGQVDQTQSKEAPGFGYSLPPRLMKKERSSGQGSGQAACRNRSNVPVDWKRTSSVHLARIGISVSEGIKIANSLVFTFGTPTLMDPGIASNSSTMATLHNYAGSLSGGTMSDHHHPPPLQQRQQWSIPSDPSIKIKNSLYSKRKQSNLYKTEYCRNWAELGECRYGKKCCYAHGDSELRQTRKHHRYKTEICRSYHGEGTCPYGIRCNYIHDDHHSNETATWALPTRQMQSQFFATHDQKVPTGSQNHSIWDSKVRLYLETGVPSTSSLFQWRTADPSLPTDWPCSSSGNLNHYGGNLDGTNFLTTTAAATNTDKGYCGLSTSPRHIFTA
ncbi:hypothetical protein [Absidia glauca]|uniref:C3H1-type domain-containing protein n=1 Tax=Absidia glauca TaxID=4829 RepID=A0A163K8E2_ABSGL|nr:hypothetical protein [Absidia glauca]